MPFEVIEPVALTEARDVLADAEEAEAAAKILVQFEQERYALKEITRGQLQVVKNKLARAQELNENAKAMIRGLERADTAHRASEALEHETWRKTVQRDAREAAMNIEADFGRWLGKIDAEYDVFDHRARELASLTGGLSPLRSFSDSRAGGLLSIGISAARQMWPMKDRSRR